MLRRISDVLGIRHKELVNDGAFDGKLGQIRDSDHFYVRNRGQVSTFNIKSGNGVRLRYPIRDLQKYFISFL